MIRKPWGSEVVIFESGQARVKLLRVKPGKRLSYQYHEEKSEAMMLIAGKALIHDGQGSADFRDMALGAVYPIAPRQHHRLMGTGTAEAVILEMAHGSDQDIVRLADDFGRATTTQQPKQGEKEHGEVSVRR